MYILEVFHTLLQIFIALRTSKYVHIHSCTFAYIRKYNRNVRFIFRFSYEPFFITFI